MAAALCGGTICFNLHATPTFALAPPPSDAAQAGLRRAFKASAEGILPAADDLFTKAISDWKEQPPDELAALFKERGKVRFQQNRLAQSLADLTKSLELMQVSGSTPDPSEIQRAYVLRARVNAASQAWRAAESDLSAAITRLDELDAIEATNPYLYAERSAARSRLGDYAGASDDALRAETDFKLIGEKVRRILAAADAALALYGNGEVEPAIEKMRYVFKNKGVPASNNPDDIGLLQELSRKDAELHLAYAGHLFDAEQKRPEAERQWESGCVRLEAYVQDGLERQREEEALLQKERQLAEAQGKSETLRASSVALNPFNSDTVARLNGLDPQSPYVTQRPQRSYFWYKVGEGEIERRDAGIAFADVDATLSCAKFRSNDWLRENRPDWPEPLVARVGKYAANVPQGAIVMPPKGSPPTRGELDF